MKIMLLGDTHGNTKFITNVAIPAAESAGADWIYQVGDFGYWEHTDEGQDFLDEVSAELTETGQQIVFIAGNHDKTSLIFRKYSQISGFYMVRPNIWFAPNGTVWSPNDGETNFIALGGAYSVDKNYRLEQEEWRAQQIVANPPFSVDEYSPKYILDYARSKTRETIWFPEEEMTEDEFETILSNTKDRIDVILAHDKPLSSNPMMKLLPIAECAPNQRRLQKAVNVLKPKLFIHGHLHARYTDTIRCGDDNAYTRVEGLGADVPNFNQLESSWEPKDAWEFLILKG